MNLLQDFKNKPFIEAVQSFFKNLNVPVNEISTAPANAIDIIGDNPLNNLISEVYAYGIVDDAIFEQNKTFNNLEDIKLLKTDYDGILIFGITLHPRENYLLPTRTQLADITRAFSRTFKYTPLTIVFKYGNHIAFANSERTQFKQAFRDGEKIGKVSLLRDIDFINVHTGHEKILNNLTIDRSGKNAITNFDTLYKYWQEVLSVSILNKTFYNELSNWYFWAIKEVQFPNEPIQLDFDSLEKYDEAVKEHKGKNVIRLLTRILFIWFIKEKGLIPEDIFDEKEIASQFIDGFTPQKPEGMFANGKHSSKYYRAILQNLFFATLNQQQGERKFRIENAHQNVTQLMRYKSYLKNPEQFIQLMEETVPFMNGGLFECLDKPHPTTKGSKGGDIIIYTDGFSDREDNNLVVPDFLFFDADEDVDLSKDYGSAKYKKSKTRGLIAILKSYKFTITENTPIDEDVALDPELLGKVFENLLASYNPETKTTARKQTGSFYTPREIVNYMVEESLITYLKNELLHEDAGIVEIGKTQIAMFGNEVKTSQLSLEQKIDESPFKDKEGELVTMLHQLVSYSNFNPFDNYPEVKKKIIKALDNCKILDPACGSGAYPMGILQKMVHILHKIDTNNTEWKQRQIDRVNKAIEELELNDSTVSNEKSIKELKTQINDIESSFENNELDYGRKLYLIENCIYGVDIQPIATQISKLRFFISLVVDQKVDKTQKDFGIRPLPNLETKFVAANTLIGINKTKTGQFLGSLFDKKEVQKLEKELKKVRHKIFSIKTPKRKRELREEDKELREKISNLLSEDYGNETAKLLANWDPYDQNTSSSFFDKEWMFDINDGFDIVIGNPPYVKVQNLQKNQTDYFKNKFVSAKGKYDIYVLFIENSINDLINENGQVVFINPHRFMIAEYGLGIRQYLIKQKALSKILVFGVEQVFDEATTYTGIFFFSKNSKSILFCEANDIKLNDIEFKSYLYSDIGDVWSFKSDKSNELLSKLTKHKLVKDVFAGIYQGLISMGDDIQMLEGIIVEDKFIGYSKRLEKNVEIESALMKPVLKGENIIRYSELKTKIYVFYPHIINEKNKTIPIDDINFKNNFPLGFKYISNFKDELELKKIKYKTNPKFWYSLHRSRELSLFKSDKIITPQLQNKSSFTIDTNNYFPDAGGYMIVKKENDLINLNVYLAIFNSSLFYYFITQTSTPYNNNYFYFKTNYIQPFSIPVINESFKSLAINLVDDIISMKKNNLSTLELESKIDLMVYKLYELTYDEVLIIEPEFSVNATDYENYKL